MKVPSEKIICHDCKKEITDIKIDEKNQKITGAVFYEWKDKMFAKCPECFKKDSVLRNFQRAEVYSRVVGYLRPVQQWHQGKKEEYEDRVEFAKGGE